MPIQMPTQIAVSWFVCGVSTAFAFSFLSMGWYRVHNDAVRIFFLKECNFFPTTQKPSPNFFGLWLSLFIIHFGWRSGIWGKWKVKPSLKPYVANKGHHIGACQIDSHVVLVCGVSLVITPAWLLTPFAKVPQKAERRNEDSTSNLWCLRRALPEPSRFRLTHLPWPGPFSTLP